jgi:hypothetical protein
VDCDRDEKAWKVLDKTSGFINHRFYLRAQVLIPGLVLLFQCNS